MLIRVPYFEARDYQKPLERYLDDGGKRAVAVWHRRAGKDLATLSRTAKAAHQRKGLYWHMLPTATQARKAIWNGFTSDGRAIVETVFPPGVRAGGPSRGLNSTEMSIDLRCGSRVQLVGSDNFDRLVGSNPIGVTFSEFALTRPSAWNYLRPILAENKGWAAFVSTPRGKNHFHSIYQTARATPGWFHELLTVHDTHAIDPSVIEEERAAGMPDALIRQEYLSDFSAALVGSVWGDLIERLEKEGQLNAFEHGTDDLMSTWDIGIADNASVWVWRINREPGLLPGLGVDFLDHYSSNNRPLSHYLDWIEEREQRLGWRFARHYLPHDGRARTFATGVSTEEQFRQRYPNVTIGPSLSLADGIQAGRWLLQQNVRFHPRCAAGLESLRQYHYEFDEDRKTYSSKPEHDWSSHDSDAFRGAACVAKYSEAITRKTQAAPTLAEELKTIVLKNGVYHLRANLDDLFEDRETHLDNRNRRL